MPIAEPDPPRKLKLDLPEGEIDVSQRTDEEMLEFKREYLATPVQQRRAVVLKFQPKAASTDPMAEAAGVGKPPGKSDLSMGIDEVVHRANPIEMVKGLYHLVTTDPRKTIANMKAIQKAVEEQGVNDIAEGRDAMGKARILFGQVPIAGPLANEVMTAFAEGHPLKGFGIVVGEGLAALEGAGVGKLGKLAKAGAGKLAGAGEALYESRLGSAASTATSAERAAAAQAGIAAGVGTSEAGATKLSSLIADGWKAMKDTAANTPGGISPGKAIASFKAARAKAERLGASAEQLNAMDLMAERFTASLKKGGAVRDLTAQEAVDMMQELGEALPPPVLAKRTIRTAESEAERAATGSTTGTKTQRGTTAGKETKTVLGKPGERSGQLTQSEGTAASTMETQAAGTSESQVASKGLSKTTTEVEADATKAVAAGRAEAHEALIRPIADQLRAKFPQLGVGEQVTKLNLEKLLAESLEGSKTLGGLGNTLLQGMIPNLAIKTVLASGKFQGRLAIMLVGGAKKGMKLSTAKAQVAAYAADLAKIIDQQAEQAPQE